MIRSAVRASALVLIGIVLAVPAAGRFTGPPPKDRSTYEYDVKAVFLFNFTRYIRWPAVLAPEGLTVVVFGESPIVPPLREIARKMGSEGSPIVIRQCLEVGEIGRPRVLFIAKSALPHVARILEKVRGTDTLTVGEAEGLAARGVAINFVERDGTIRFEVSERALKQARIEAGSQLLKLAILVDEETGGAGR